MSNSVPLSHADVMVDGAASTGDVVCHLFGIIATIALPKGSISLFRSLAFLFCACTKLYLSGWNVSE